MKLAQLRRDPNILRAALQWSHGDDTGASSKSILKVVLGLPVGEGGVNHPYDPADFGRCHRLLKAIPALKEHLPMMAARSKVWAAYLPEWERMTQIFLRDQPAGKSSELYRVMDGLRDPIEMKLRFRSELFFTLRATAGDALDETNYKLQCAVQKLYPELGKQSNRVTLLVPSGLLSQLPTTRPDGVDALPKLVRQTVRAAAGKQHYDYAVLHGTLPFRLPLANGNVVAIDDRFTATLQSSVVSPQPGKHPDGDAEAMQSLVKALSNVAGVASSGVDGARPRRRM